MSHVIESGSRLGLIAEGKPDLAVVANWLTRLLRQDLRLLPADQRTLAPRPILLREAPKVARALLDSGCAHVIVLWDAARFGTGEDRAVQGVEAQRDLFWKHCDAFDAARGAGAALPRERLCPVVALQELESWLLADERALEAYLSTATRPVRVVAPKRPEREPNPKKVLCRLFREHGGKDYVDYVDAGPLAAKVASLQRLRRQRSFQELMANVNVAPGGADADDGD